MTDLIAEGRSLVPWHLDVEVRPGLSTRDFAHDDYPEEFGRVRMIDPRPRFMETLARVFPDGLAGRSVLDCACNCGGFLFWARDAGAGKCLGVDAREHWIDQARFLVRHRERPSDGMTFEVCDLYDLPGRGLPQYDVTLFNGIFYHLPDPLGGLRVAAGLTREVLILNTATKIGLPDGMLSIFEESRTRAVSGVYGLSWFPTGPQVVAQMLRWAGLPEVRCNWWRRLPGQPEGHARMELVAARDTEALWAFDAAVAREGSPLAHLIETAIPPEGRVLVPEGVAVATDGRETIALDEHDGDDAVVARLEAERTRGARWLAVPAECASWLEDRPALREHVRGRYMRAASEPSGTLFSLF
jgi:hypothetical protein